jgi:hypothetical protein
LTIALLMHEIATNSAKYGSLSMPEGRVVLRSSLSDEILRIEWQESGGPFVSSPATHGFGLRLLSRALEQFGGGTDILFEPSGLVCRMSLKLTADVKPDALGHDGDQTLADGHESARNAVAADRPPVGATERTSSASRCSSDH